MNRRRFLIDMGRGLKTAALLGALPMGSARAAAGASAPEGVIHSPRTGPGLREIAARRLHHGADRYINPFSPETPRNMGRLLVWKLFSKNAYRPQYAREQVRPVTVDWGPVWRHPGVSVTFLKHAGLMIKDRDAYLLVDPVFFDLFRFIQDFSPLAFDVGQIDRPAHVLITHGHYDHLDRATLSSLGKDTHVITPLGHDAVFEDLGMRRRTQLDWFGSFSDGRLRVTLLPCNHWTMRNPFRGPNRSLWGSYLVETAAGIKIFVSGDTAYFEGFEELGGLFDIDLAIFNLGAYEPRWFMARSHANPEETLRATRELGARYLMIVHWGTFRLGDEPVFLPPEDIRKALGADGGGLGLLDAAHGQTVFFGPDGQPRVGGAHGA